MIYKKVKKGYYIPKLKVKGKDKKKCYYGRLILDNLYNKLVKKDNMFKYINKIDKTCSGTFLIQFNNNKVNIALQVLNYRVKKEKFNNINTAFIFLKYTISSPEIRILCKYFEKVFIPKLYNI